MIKKSLFRAAIAVSILSLSGATAAYSQATDGNIVGNVIDSSGGAIPNAKVEAENIATDVKTEVTADSAGFYRADNLLVGTYKLTVNAPGFARRWLIMSR